jgi:hypothetical protein
MIARRVARAGLLVVAEVGAVVVLHRLGTAPGFGLPGADVGRWLRETPPLDATAAILRLVALGGAWWLLASTVWWLLLAVRGVARPRSIAAMPGTRRLVEAALAVTLAAGTTLTGPAASAAPATPTTTTTTAPLVLGRGPNGVRSGRAGLGSVPAAPAPPASTTTSTTTMPPAGARQPAPAPAAPPAPPAPPATPAVASVHVVAPGESLWVIAADRVGAATNRPAAAVPPGEVAPYWRKLCDANRTTVRSGDLDLIFPGEVLELPDL